MESSNGSDFELGEHRGLVASVHLARGLIAAGACVPNATMLVLLYMAFRQSRVWRTRVNLAVCDLMISNLIMCTVLCAYSFVQALSPASFDRLDTCLVMTWLAIFASFAPSWAMLMIALSRLIFYADRPRLEHLASRIRLLTLRLVLVVSDVLFTGLIVDQVRGSSLENHCNYQLMLDGSAVYLVYSFIIFLCLVVVGGTSLVLRIVLRIRLLRQVYVTEKPLSTVDGKLAPSLMVQPPSRPVPGVFWQKPKLIFIAVVVCVLFLMPRIAFFCGNRRFWLFSTLCPALMAFFLPLFFLWTTKICRRLLSQLCCPSSNTQRLDFDAS